ncbi:N-6 DNA methylase [Nocardia sp. CWNU-33]|uniref:type I restriction-modification system subunit M n=1 Tax=Nocardia sp. CWNU-33 TaxID=3392117 RepID=UPI00398F519E
MGDDSGHLVEFIWSVSDLLRGDFKSADYGHVILPFTVLRRLDCLLDQTRGRVQESLEQLTYSDVDREERLTAASGHAFYSTTPMSLQTILDSPRDTARRLRAYVQGFSSNVQEVMEQFEFDRTISRLAEAGVLYQVLGRFASLDLGPTRTNREMDSAFEELIRRFAERGYANVGEYSTPRDVARVMVGLMVAEDTGLPATSGVARTVLDPICGAGGLLKETQDYIKSLNPRASVALSGQELNHESWAICRSSMIIGGRDPQNIALGNVFSDDGHAGQRFDYLLAGPPFGLSWATVKDTVWREQMEHGFAGRFGAGLPRTSDGALLYLQHMLAKMKPVDSFGKGGSRVAVLFSSSPMYVGAPGSGESEIRRWIIENDWLEGVIALPDQLLHNTGMGTYVWVLTNRKPTDRRGKVLLLNAQDSWQKMRRSLAGKRKYIGPDQLTEIIGLYSEARPDAAEPLDERVRVVSNNQLGHRRIVVERPLRLRYELSEDAHRQLAESRSIQSRENAEALLAAIHPLVGSKWSTESKALAAMRRAATDSNQTWPRGTAFETAIRKAIGVRDTSGEIQRVRGALAPDPDLRMIVNLELDEDPEEYLRRKVHPRVHDAWIDHDRTTVGYEISPTLFYVAELNGSFKLLRHFVTLVTAKVNQPRDEAAESGTDRPKHLRAQDLHQVDSAVELPEVSTDAPPLTPCTGGALVGRPGNWRLLPATFGDAVTSLFVMHPLEGISGRALCEWLNSRKDNGRFPNARDVLDTHIPVELVTDDEIDDLLDTIQAGRRTLNTTMSGILPNVFTAREKEVEEVRNRIRFAAYEATLVGDLVRPLDDPIWRAEWSYPFHVAALARRFRISTHPAEQKDGLLKLGEGLARALGILALSEISAKNGFTENLRKSFRSGATFGTWLTLLGRLPTEVENPRIRQLVALQERDGVSTLLEGIKEFRNNSHHSHGVRASHEITLEVEKLEPKIVSAIDAASWLSGVHWDWVERCEYLEDSSFKIVGLRLRGSHPNWEPFERTSSDPLKPGRVYVENTPASTPVDLWPFAAVNLCDTCRTHELFLLNKVRGDQLTLRSLEEHSMEITYNGGE